MHNSETPTLSVVLPTLNAAATLETCLSALHAWSDTLQLIVVDGGSKDDTVKIAHAAGATILPAEKGRGAQLARGGVAATRQWVLFLHADTVLSDDWVGEVQTYISKPAQTAKAAAFRFALDDGSPSARRIERMVAWRCRRLGLPYGDQGLLIRKDLYDEIGGYRPLPLMEDVDLVRRIGRRDIHMFEARAVTSAERYRKNGWWARPSRNLFCLFIYMCGVPPRWIAKLYG
ncbi:MAG: TIGR04283 family arsenosugar biosynthesis glycosyltransferase [Rhodospirillaceae bacterium]